MITLITATLPERRHLFADLARSVALQTLPPQAWLVEWDYEHRGPVEVINNLVEQVETEWFFRIDDDDLLEHDHFDTLKPYLTDEADIVYSWCRVEGQGSTRLFQRPFSTERLKVENYIPSAAAIRTSLWRDLGGYEQAERTPHEDYDFWLRALEAGARFVCVPIQTWVYRMGDWAHRSEHSSFVLPGT